MRIHVVSPVFHGYWRAIATALEHRGHSVTTHTYDSHDTLPRRAWHQLRHELPLKVGVGDHRALLETYTSAAVESLRDSSPEAVVIVKGDTLGEPFWDASSSLPRVTWLYDEIRRTRWTTDSLARVGPVATYSSDDNATFNAIGLNSRHLPLAFDHRLSREHKQERTGDVSFVGARYPSREEVLLHLYGAGVPIRAYGRDWSGHPVDRLRTWRVTGTCIPAARDVTRAGAYDIMAASAATLNLHGDQDGFTMRTFEACGVGGLQFIDRSDLQGLYQPGIELLTWTELDELVELCERAARDLRWSNAIRSAGRARTIAEHTFDQRVITLEAAWDTA